MKNRRPTRQLTVLFKRLVSKHGLSMDVKPNVASIMFEGVLTYLLAKTLVTFSEVLHLIELKNFVCKLLESRGHTDFENLRDNFILLIKSKFVAADKPADLITAEFYDQVS